MLIVPLMLIMYCRKMPTATRQVLLILMPIVMLWFQTVRHNLERSFLTVRLENLGVGHIRPLVTGVDRYQLVGHSPVYLYAVTSHFQPTVIHLCMLSLQMTCQAYQPVSHPFIRNVAM